MFNMCNVVFYDGCDSKVVKMILPFECGKLTKESKEFVHALDEKYGKSLYIDLLYPVTLDNIIAFKECEFSDLQNAYALFEKFFNQNS